mmetsp:Transcript_19485/g.61840  ORF Transcript_19485/g.61840 Transcript_19485/m.61840 type:complete len:214 (-) Transcript_19485:125-766(-)
MPRSFSGSARLTAGPLHSGVCSPGQRSKVSRRRAIAACSVVWRLTSSLSLDSSVLAAESWSRWNLLCSASLSRRRCSSSLMSCWSRPRRRSLSSIRRSSNPSRSPATFSTPDHGLPPVGAGPASVKTLSSAWTFASSDLVSLSWQSVAARTSSNFARNDTSLASAPSERFRSSRSSCSQRSTRLSSFLNFLLSFVKAASTSPPLLPSEGWSEV